MDSLSSRKNDTHKIACIVAKMSNTPAVLVSRGKHKSILNTQISPKTEESIIFVKYRLFFLSLQF